MKVNEGTVDRVVRVVFGLALLSLFFFAQGALAYVGLVGVVPLITGIAGHCPLYSVLGVDTCPVDKVKHA